MMPEILQLATAGKADPYNIAALYGVRGEKDSGFAWFDKALRRDPRREWTGTIRE
jgi:hypothetical protein